MAFDPTTPSSRRAILAAALGGVAASVASAVVGPSDALAADGETVVTGGTYVPFSKTTFLSPLGGGGPAIQLHVLNAESGTAIKGYANHGIGIAGTSDSDGTGVSGDSATGIGVRGKSTSWTGVSGESTTGFGTFGEATTGTGAYGLSDSGIGVHGDSASNNGVFGHSGTGYAVEGYSDESIGVFGRSDAYVGMFGQSAVSNGTVGYSNSPAYAGTVGSNDGGNTGVFGFSGVGPPPATPARTGVFGYSATDTTSRGAVGQGAGTGVHGYAGTGTVPAPSAKTGVYGRCDTDATARGVAGYSPAGSGLYGVSSSGSAVTAIATGTTGYALKTTGRLAFTKVSGVATVAAGTTASAVITPGTDITSGAYVLLTPQADPGTRRFWATLDLTANTLTVRTNATDPAAIKIAWLLVG